MHRSLTKNQDKKLNKFIDLALEFNKTHNIFVRKNKDEVIKKDFKDCLPLFKIIKDGQSVIDLGSGGGFPGMLLAIVKPNSKINLLESSIKKCFFLRTTIEKLSLTNTKVINETIKENNHIGVFDVITARAFASTKKIITLTKNNTHKNSRYVLLKGRKKTIEEELNDIDKNQYICEIIEQDTKKYERNIILIKKNE
ncbi:MAG: 16S rRNA (guanine(527)-N(7))-methyltransferase RsmG [Gammaproteobacteria bacterium]|nr:16S rRNA (guanine(527)-N(7))-methyltransferase RsmG [Gammaproteobacteria bacterium]|tara:strand:- start:4214 stop:4804 length:591 start_codon:yes stop_codon:yes gene_type:complete